MLNGDIDEFVENLYYGREMNFAYADKQYFIQGWKEDGFFTLELCQTIPLTTNEGYCVWNDSSENPQECVNKFFNAKIFNGKSFWDAEKEIDWLYDWPIDDIEETKMYYLKHPEDINLPNALKIDLTPKKISEMDENFQNFAKRMITKTDFGTFTNSEFYNKSGEVMTGIEFLTWYFEEGFKYNEYSWKKDNYEHTYKTKSGRVITYKGREYTRNIKSINSDFAEIDTINDLFVLLLEVWCKETAYPSCQKEYNEEENPSFGQCAITATLVHDIFGGTIHKICLNGGGTHYFNKINDIYVDLTSDQFKFYNFAAEYEPNEEIPREFCGKNKNTQYRFELLVNLLKKKINQTVSKSGNA